MRVVLIKRVEYVEGLDKLLKLTLNLGGSSRQVFSSLRAAYPDPQVLEGRLTIMVANLASRKMRCGVSEGMVITAGPGGKDIFSLSPDAGGAARHAGAIIRPAPLRAGVTGAGTLAFVFIRFPVVSTASPHAFISQHLFLLAAVQFTGKSLF